MALLVACSAVPVLAAESTEATTTESSGFTPPTSKEEEIAANQVPDAGEISKALGEAERKEGEREDWLATPEAIEQREDSRLAFSDISANESEELLRSIFGEQLEALNTDPSRFLSDAQLIQPLGDSGAVVKAEGEGSLLETTVPVRTEDDEGELAKVDLSLEATPEGFQTANAVSDLVLPDSADEAIQVGDGGFEIAQAGAEDSSASPFGDKNLFYPSVLPDTDLLVAGNSFGAEIFDLLRSKDSPENLSFAIELPEGSELRSDERGGAEVSREGERLVHIPKPVATDAQGTDVPVELEVSGSSIELHLAHRSGDYAYPILVDPIIEDWVNQGKNWYGGSNWDALSNGAWQWTSNNSNILHNICCWEGSHAGLLTIVQDAFYGPEQYGQWSYGTGNEKVFITHAWLVPFNRADNGCGSAQPHDYVGLWNPPGNWIPLQTNRAKDYGNASFDGYGKALVLGQGSGPPGVWLACDRILYSGGVGIWLNDDWGPIISPTGIPSQWFSDTDHLNIDIYAGDEGLGVHRVTITPEGKPVIQDNVGNCTGLYGHRCPTGYTAHFAVTGDSFGEGVRTTGTVAEDPTGKTAGTQFTTKVDRTPPEVTLDGQLALATDEEKGDGQDPEKWDELSLPVYNLKVEAKDGSLTNNLTKRSGVKNIEVFLDGKKMEVPWSPLASCPNTSCEMTKTYTLKMAGLSSGEHTLEVKALDFVNKVRERKIEFEYIPATGMKDEYVMHYFPLPDGQGNEAEEEHPARPELAVNVMSGNLVYRERDIDVASAAAVDLEVERFYNSQLPTAENTEWGDGWTLAETPDLDPVDTGGSPAPDQAQLVDTSGAIEDVALPTVEGGEEFDPGVQAKLIKRTGGGYEMTDETGESATSVVFDETGQTEARLTEDYAKVDYDYESGDLSEIAVEDPGTVSMSAEELEEEEASVPQVPTYSSSIGQVDPGAEGPFKSPGDVAVDTQGNLWIVDKGNNRIQKFSPQGNFLTKFGAYGTGNGQFNRPTAIAIAANGDLLITDAGNARVQRFSSSGAYLSKFGSKGTGNGQFAGAGPEGIAIDASGNIWVSDTGGGRLEKFSSTGTFIKSIASKGSGSGQLGEPTSIAVDAGNNIWVTDWLNNRLSVFNNNGEFKSQVGSAGTGNGQFNCPDGIEIDSYGNVWVGDQNNGRVQQFDVAGQYKSQFGSAGDPGQFEHLMGIATDSNGHIWVTDTVKNRIQKWVIPGQPTFYSSYGASFGAYGTGNGQLKSPADVAVDTEGDLWVLDKGNNRVQHFNPQGQFVSQFGSSGSTDGKFNTPSAIAFDGEGNIWITDTGNNRLQKFNAKGEFLAKFGSTGTGNGQFKEPIGIAVAQSNGWIYVVDRGNNRVQLFSKGGGYLGQTGTPGSGNQQLSEPSAIALGGPSGGSAFTLLIADSGNNRVLRWTSAGAYVSQFGTKGTGGGQLDRPEAIDVDSQGEVWVGDRNNGRIQVFDEAGKYLDQVGSKGSGQGAFSFAVPMGIATSEGHAYVTDTANNRIQDWVGVRYTPRIEVAPTGDDPSLEVETPSGLVSSVAGDEVGTHTYSHTGDDLVAHKSPGGETKYVYDAGGRMTKVTLPNGTWGEIVYFSDGRVKSVKVDPAGSEPAKKTEFEYSDEPRRTVVIPPDAPHVTYDIGNDGSVLKWWNSEQPPTIDDIAGTLYDNRGKLLWNGDHELSIQAHSEEGIASIQVIVNGGDLVDEKTCEKPSVLECKTEVDAWVTSTDLHAPGRLDLEVIVTDRLGHTASERFWVDIPQPPPPLAPGTPIPPKFRDIAKFREEYGLEVVFPVASEIELNERIFNLIKAWYEPETPAGQVARATMSRWGSPLRPADVAELEYREWYIEQNGPKIQAWGEANSPNTYAGYWVDHRGGGVMRVGFTSNQAATVSTLRGSGQLVVADRIGEFTAAPGHPISELVSLQGAIGTDDGSSGGSLAGKITRAGIDMAKNTVTVGATDVGNVSAGLSAHYGGGAPINVYADSASPQSSSSRYTDHGPIKAGQMIGKFTHQDANGKHYAECTAGPSAWEKVGTKSNGQPKIAHFLITAGHCYKEGANILRFHDDHTEDAEVKSIGEQRSRLWQIYTDPQKFEADGEAIRLNSEALASAKIVGDRASKGAGAVEVGMTVCESLGKRDYVECQPVRGPAEVVPFYAGKEDSGPFWLVPTFIVAMPGDSGAPVYSRRTGKVLGINVFGPPSVFMPLLAPPLPEEGPFPYFHPDRSQAPGLLNEPLMGDLHLVKE